MMLNKGAATIELGGIRRMACASAFACCLAVTIVLILALAAPMRAWAEDAPPETFNGGAYDVSWYTLHQDEGIFVIETPEQLAGLAYLVNGISTRYYDESGSPCLFADSVGSFAPTYLRGKTVVLKNDIDLSAYTWDSPIGSSGGDYGGGNFGGLFDGQGHTVNGLHGAAPGFFGCVRGGVVQNLVLEGGLTIEANVHSLEAVGGVVARLQGGAVYDCTSRLTLNFAYQYAWGSNPQQLPVGGIVGRADSHKDFGGSSIVGCLSQGELVTVGQYAGGIAGSIESGSYGTVRIENCRNEANVTSSSPKADAQCIGGIVGMVAASGSYCVTGCVNTGDITATTAVSCAGIVGKLGLNEFFDGSYTVENCVNTGAVTSAGGYACGITVREYRSDKASDEGRVVRNCYSSGAVSTTMPNRAFGVAALLPGEVSASADVGWWNNYVVADLPLFPASANAPAEAATAMSAESLEDAADLLGEAFLPPSVSGANGGFPVLCWQDPNAVYTATVRAVVADDFNDDGAVPVALLFTEAGALYRSQTMTLTTDGQVPSSDGASAGSEADPGYYEAVFSDLPQGRFFCEVSKHGYDDLPMAVIVNTRDVSSAHRLSSTRYPLSVSVSPSSGFVAVRDSRGDAVKPVSRMLAGGRVLYEFGLVNGDYSYDVSAFGHTSSLGNDVTISYAGAQRMADLPAAAVTSQQFSFIPPSGVSFSPHDPIMYLFLEEELCAMVEPDLTDAGAISNVDLPEGTYSYVVKAGGCEELRGDFQVIGDGSHAFQLEAQLPWDGESLDRSWYDYHAGEADLYLRTPADFVALADMVSIEKKTFEGVTLHVSGSMDFGGHELLSIGYATNSDPARPFMGVFDGGGFTLGNFELRPRTKDDGYSGSQTSSSALFGCAVSATIRDVVVRDAVSPGFGSYFTAGLVGYADNVTIASCDVSADVRTSSQYGAVICARLSTVRGNSVVVDCVSRGSLIADDDSNFGGIVGLCDGSCAVVNCENRASLEYRASTSWPSSYARMGGICGSSISGPATFENCVNYGSVTSQRAQIAGIVGEASSSASVGGEGTAISNCGNRGNITCAGMASGYSGVGGILGCTGTANGYIKLTECYNAGTVSNEAAESTASAGGIMGAVDAMGTRLRIANCYNTGAVQATGNARAHAGGISADVFADMAIANCYNVGAVSAGSAARAGALAYTAGVSAAAAFSNSHYLSGSAKGAFGGADDAAAVAGKVALHSADYMRSLDFLAELNADGVFGPDDENVNDGFPVIGRSVYEKLTAAAFSVPYKPSYTGEPIISKLVVRNIAGDMLVEGEDYLVTCANPAGEACTLTEVVDVGDYAVTVIGQGHYFGSVSKRVEIQPVDISAGMFTAHDVPFTGRPVAFSDAVATQLVEGRDFEAVASLGFDLTAIGSQEFKVRGQGNYDKNTSLVYIPFQIFHGEISVGLASNLTYDGQSQTPRLSVTNTIGDEARLLSDYTVEYYRAGLPIDLSDVKDAGTYSVTVTGQGNYAGSSDTLEFSVDAALFEVAPLSPVRYTGEPVEPFVDAVLAGSSIPLVAGDDFTVSYLDSEGRDIASENVVEPGSYTALVKGTGNYQGTVRCPFSVVKTDFSVSPIARASFTGKPVLPKVEVRDGDKIMEQDRDYELTYWKIDNGKLVEVPADKLVDAGMYTARVKGVGAYSGVLEAVYIVGPAAISFAGGAGDLSFTGQALDPGLTVVAQLANESATLAEGADYTLQYTYEGQAVDAADIVNAGTYSAVAMGLGNYDGSRASVEFVVAPSELTVDEIAPAVYNAGAQPPIATVRAGGEEIDSSFYTTAISLGGKPVDRLGVVQAGSYVVDVAPTESVRRNFANGDATVQVAYEVLKAPLAARVSEGLVFTGETLKPEVTALSGERVLAESEYTLLFSDKDGSFLSAEEVRFAGSYTATVRVNSPGNFETGEATASFSVARAPVSVDAIGELAYTGAEVAPTVIVRSGGRVLESADYTVTYRDSSGAVVPVSQLIKPGSYAVVVSLADTENYEATTVERGFAIVDETPEGPVVQAEEGGGSEPRSGSEEGSESGAASGAASGTQAESLASASAIPAATESSKDADAASKGDSGRPDEALATSGAEASKYSDANAVKTDAEAVDGALASPFSTSAERNAACALIGVVIAAFLSIIMLFFRRTKEQDAFIAAME